jgi:hypothetical protein
MSLADAEAARGEREGQDDARQHDEDHGHDHDHDHGLVGLTCRMSSSGDKGGLMPCMC